eukprot:TRINITY_DN4860_c0_g1_i1.p1 TRINITY_DN4860_c0_g1~~TRINITY_DN4860_c0_g1_i1.p1  ORF type:complete len:245 (-),score=65.31 TRINITY_DN4860_c0_g1_i1:27-761(-)
MSLAETFDLIAEGIKADSSLVKSVGGSYLFNITNDGATKSWIVDLKNAPGNVTQGTGKADCTLTVSETDFLALASGKLNGQQAFMQGKLKINGNMGLAMKLASVFAAAKKKSDSQAATQPAAQPAASAGATPPVDAKFIFNEISKNIASDASLVPKVGGTYQFNINTSSGEKSWTVDLKNAPGSVKEGKSSADCTITMKEDDFVALMTGKINGQQAFMQGKLKIGGNMQLAMKLQNLTAKKSNL